VGYEPCVTEPGTQGPKRRGGEPVVGIIMGSDSDLPTLKPASDICAEFNVAHEVRIVSAHRTPLDMAEYGRSARERGIKVIIAAAGGAAHLPGMIAAHTTLPVIGVPVPVEPLRGFDALLSIVQMPRGVPVATVAIGGAQNAGLLAIEILATCDAELAERLESYRGALAESTRLKNRSIARDKPRAKQ
jgi:5-(carboxyamino)imidazole ribonucleotide mutase